MNLLGTDYKSLEVPSISSKIKPDASIATKDDKIMFIDVLSETSVKTIRKLYHVLLLQLVYIRSVNKQTEEVSGFVLPKNPSPDFNCEVESKFVQVCRNHNSHMHKSV